MGLETKKYAIGIFPRRSDAEFALSELRESGFSMDKVSLVAREDTSNDEIAGIDLSSGAADCLTKVGERQ